jgi:hypothetical protein
MPLRTTVQRRAPRPLPPVVPALAAAAAGAARLPGGVQTICPSYIAAHRARRPLRNADKARYALPPAPVHDAQLCAELYSAQPAQAHDVPPPRMRPRVCSMMCPWLWLAAPAPAPEAHAHYMASAPNEPYVVTVARAINSLSAAQARADLVSVLVSLTNHNSG